MSGSRSCWNRMCRSRVCAVCRVSRVPLVQRAKKTKKKTKKKERTWSVLSLASLQLHRGPLSINTPPPSRPIHYSCVTCSGLRRGQAIMIPLHADLPVSPSALRHRTESGRAQQTTRRARYAVLPRATASDREDPCSPLAPFRFVVADPNVGYH